MDIPRGLFTDNIEETQRDKCPGQRVNMLTVKIHSQGFFVQRRNKSNQMFLIFLLATG